MENDCLWLAKGKVMYYISIKWAFQCFLQLGDMCFSSWDTIFFVTPGFQESKTVSVGQISRKFELKNAWLVSCAIKHQWRVIFVVFFMGKAYLYGLFEIKTFFTTQLWWTIKNY